MSRVLNIGDVKFYELLILFVRWGEIEWGIALTLDILTRPHNKVLFPKERDLACRYGWIDENENRLTSKQGSDKIYGHKLCLLYVPFYPSMVNQKSERAHERINSLLTK